MKIFLASKKGSKAATALLEATSLTRCTKKLKPDFILNYGLSHALQNTMATKYPLIKHIPVINKNIGQSKYNVINTVEAKGILVPTSKIALNKTDDIQQWIVKKFHSCGGKGIAHAKTKASLPDKYYQQLINKVYELRIHAFSWVDQTKWGAYKRVGNKDKLAWNFSNGGTFITINNRQMATVQAAFKMSEIILKTLRMEFGALDFLVDSKNNVYFIEVNSQPGMNGLSNQVYIDAINTLFKMTPHLVTAKFNH